MSLLMFSLLLTGISLSSSYHNYDSFRYYIDENMDDYPDDSEIRFNNNNNFDEDSEEENPNWLESSEEEKDETVRELPLQYGSPYCREEIGHRVNLTELYGRFGPVFPTYYFNVTCVNAKEGLMKRAPVQMCKSKPMGEDKTECISKNGELHIFIEGKKGCWRHFRTIEISTGCVCYNYM